MTAEAVSRRGRAWRVTGGVSLTVGALLVVALLVWQALAAGGAPDPLAAGATPAAAVFDIGVLVFREGLECVLVLAAITASLRGSERLHQRPIGVGVVLGFAATLITWLLFVGVVDRLTASLPALDVQAATGLLAIVVLLVVMNWFFHEVYWTGWIKLHNRRKRNLLSEVHRPGASGRRLFWGLALLGFSSFYREGFEVVLFLQSYQLRLGGGVVLKGVLIGGLLAAVVALLTFVARRRLPYRRMLVLTGVLLGLVLLVMVGEQVQEMQQAHWLPTTPIPGLSIPDWMGLWFSLFPTVQSLAAQSLAGLAVVGSYFVARLRVQGAVARAQRLA
jgi:high-affinity iron transporter